LRYSALEQLHQHALRQPAVQVEQHGVAPGALDQHAAALLVHIVERARR
jgi:hypothetical protein